MKKTKIIVNPVAGRGGAGRAVPLVVKKLHEANLVFEIVKTERPYHAVELTRAAVRDGFETVAAMGGDGTVNEVINGLMQAKEAGEGNSCLGVIGVGRGNDFAYGVDILHDLDANCRKLAEGRRRTIDIGRVWVDRSESPRYFGNGIGIGFDTVVGFEAQKIKWLKGFLSYAAGALKTLFLYFTAPVIKLDYNDQAVTAPCLMVSVMNGRRMGGGFMMAPDGDTGDGLLDLCIVGQTSRRRILGLIVKFMKGAQAGEPEVTTARTRRIHIEAQTGVLPAHADGETLCVEGKKILAEIAPHPLEVIC